MIFVAEKNGQHERLKINYHGALSKDIFEGHFTSGSKAFPFLISRNATKTVLLVSVLLLRRFAQKNLDKTTTQECKTSTSC